MKIWFPTICAQSGSDVYVKQLAQALNTQGHQAVITWLPQKIEILPSLAYRYKPPVGTDLIHTNSWNGYPFARFSLPMLTTAHHWVHDPVLDKYQSMAQRLYHKVLIERYERKTLQAAKKVVVVSEFAGAILCQYVKNLDINVIHNSVDSQFFCPSDSAVSAKSVFRLLFVGSPDTRKGFDLLQPIMQRLGKGYHLSYLTQKKHKPLVGDNITHVSAASAEQLREQYRLCDALLFPTRYEGFGYVVAEAMACGKPVVSTDCSAIPELVEHHYCGLLSPIDAVNDYVTNIKWLNENRDKCKIYGQNARRKMQEHFSNEVMLKRYLKLYGDVLVHQ